MGFIRLGLFLNDEDVMNIDCYELVCAPNSLYITSWKMSGAKATIHIGNFIYLSFLKGSIVLVQRFWEYLSMGIW